MRIILFVMSCVCIAGCAGQRGDTDADRAQSGPTNGSIPRHREPGWEHAEEVWQAFAEKHLAEARRHLEQMPKARRRAPDLEWVEYRSASIRAFLPDHRVFVLAGYRVISRSALFALSRSGEITDLGQGDIWSPSDGRDRNEQLSTFLASQNIVLDGPQRVVACVRMIGSLSHASNRVTCARINGVDFPVGLFDEDTIHDGLGNPDHWKLTPRREASAWIVTKDYVGPPASIAWPPVYELTVSADDQLIDVCHLRTFPRTKQ